MFHQLQCMRSFVNVADNGSFSRAAHAMQIGVGSAAASSSDGRTPYSSRTFHNGSVA